jgi:hypothetical protein
MRKLFKKLWNDDRGNALILFGAALPLVLGSAGLATDTVQWALWKRQLQRAADSAAYAGVYARFHGDPSSNAVTRDLTNNKHLWVPLKSGYPQVSEPTVSGYTYPVEVTLAVQQSLSFSSMFMTSTPTITATARAAGVDGDDYCVVALEDDPTVSGIIIQGSSFVDLGCGMISNSPAASVSVGVNGNAHNVTADPIAGVGGVPAVNGNNVEKSYALPQPDPYANKYSTSVPGGTPCTNMNSHVVSTSGGVTTLSPGCYTGNNQFKFNGGTTVLQDGVYYLNNVDFDAQGGTISCNACTIILTGTDPGTLKFNGNAQLNLTAPTTGDYAKMLFIQASNADDDGNNIINGNSNSMFDGAFYFPKQKVTLSGSSGAITKCAMIVGNTVDFQGNANLQNNTTGCTSNSKVMGQVIRLIG